MVKNFFIFLIVAIGLCSCDGAEPHLIITEANKATKELNEKYFDITCGEWYNEVSDSTGKIYEYIYLGKDRKNVHITKIVTREIVKINGKDTYTDWRILKNDTTKGSWKLCCIDESGELMPYIEIGTDHGNGQITTRFGHFYHADANELHADVFYFDKMKRGKAEPSF